MKGAAARAVHGNASTSSGKSRSLQEEAVAIEGPYPPPTTTPPKQDYRRGAETQRRIRSSQVTKKQKGNSFVALLSCREFNTRLRASASPRLNAPLVGRNHVDHNASTCTSFMQPLDLQILELDFHCEARVQLQGDDAGLEGLGAFVIHLGGETAIDGVGDAGAVGDDHAFVPAFVMNDFAQAL